MNAYVRERVKQALQRCRGDRQAAQRLLLQSAVKDTKLLQGLVAPHIMAITENAVAEVSGQAARKPVVSAAAGSTQKAKVPRRQKKQSSGLSSRDMERVMDALGRQIGTTTPPRGMTALITPPQKRRTNQSHADTMRQLAVAYARRRFDPAED